MPDVRSDGKSRVTGCPPDPCGKRKFSTTFEGGQLYEFHNELPKGGKDGLYQWGPRRSSYLKKGMTSGNSVCCSNYYISIYLFEKMGATCKCSTAAS